VSNDAPPHVCLAGFGFMTPAADPGQQMARSAQLEGGTMSFMSPELLIPDLFSRADAEPTPQSDIYAFGMVIYQVFQQDCGCRPI